MSITNTAQGSPLRVGLDVGGTKIDAVALDRTDTVVARVRRVTGWGPEVIAEGMRAAVRELLADPAASGRPVESLGIGFPGTVEPDRARVVHAVNLGVVELDLGAAVGDALGVPVRVENDVNAATVGAGTLLGLDGLAYLNLGTGVAAGIVAAGGLWRGARGTAGEVGHISVDPVGPLCRCGQRGCIEALSGGGVLAERWGRPGEYPVRDVLDAADAGDARAGMLRDDLARGAAAAVRVLVLTADVDAIVIGGGLSALGDRLLTPIRAALAASAADSPFLASLHLGDRLSLLPPGSPAGAIGAAILGMTRDPEEALARG